MTAPNIPAAAQSLWHQHAKQSAPPAPSAQTPASASVTPPHSPLVAALEARPRALVPYPAEAFAPGMPGNILVRVPTSAELGRAKKCAHAFIEQDSKTAPTAAQDPSYTGDIFTVFALFESLRDEKDPQDLQAFPSPQWMREQFTTQQLSVMLNMHNEVVGEKEPVEWLLDSDRISALMLVCARHAGTDIPDKALIRFSRETMAEAFIRASVMYGDAMAEIEALKAQLADLTGPPADGPTETTNDTQE